MHASYNIYMCIYVEVIECFACIKEINSPVLWLRWIHKYWYSEKKDRSKLTLTCMKVIRHAGVDSRMIILDDQARQQMTLHSLYA